MSILAVMVGATTFKAPELVHFPGSYFEAEAKVTLQRRAMEKWPGPSQIVDLWRSGDLTTREKTMILLGISASHDPLLLPIYREAIASDNGRLRMAAAYGYRDLLGDALPDVSAGVDIESARELAQEMAMVAGTLRERPLVEFWLQAALMSEGVSMPGWRGVVLRRPQATCFRAVEKVLDFHDISYLATAYRLATNESTRVSLMKLLEAITLQEFFTKPNDSRTGWGAKDINEALEAADAFVDDWVDRRCVTDPEAILSNSMSALGVAGVPPLAPGSYDFWLRVLKGGFVSWHMMAARQLYDLGGRWSQLSVFQAESKAQIAERDELIVWYRLLPAHILARGDPKPASPP